MEHFIGPVAEKLTTSADAMMKKKVFTGPDAVL